jgi:PTS system fructose-specific IIC component
VRFVGVTSCPTGIAHTYMAAEGLEQAARAAGHEIEVETQGSAGFQPLGPETIAAAAAVIFAADVPVRDRARFDGKPLVEAGVKKAIFGRPWPHRAGRRSRPAGPGDPRCRTSGSAGPAAGGLITKVDQQSSTATRVRQWLMTGVSYMIPFVAAGGILIALGFMLAQAAWGETGAVLVTKVPLTDLITGFNPGSGQDWAALLFQIGVAAFGFLVPILAGFIAFAIADRPGLAPGIVGGALAVAVARASSAA